MKNIHLKGILFITLPFSFFIMLLGLGHYSTIWLFIFSFLGLFIIGVFLDILSSRLFSQKIRRFLSGNSLGNKLYSVCSDQKLALILWFIIALFFLPAYIALFPGTFGYDTPIQAAQYYGEMELTAANPLLHTCLLGVFLSFGENVLKNASLGFSLFTLMQGLLVTQVLARSLLFLKKIRVPFTVIVVGLLWILLNPTLHALTFNATKDILFGVFLLHFLLNLLEELSDSNTSENTSQAGPITGRSFLARRYLRLLLSGIIMCLMRNAAFYLAITLFLIMFVAFRRYKGTIFSLGMVVVISWLFSAFFTHGLNIPAGNARENMSVPIQQVAAVCSASASNAEAVTITGEQLAVTREILPVDSWDIYQQDTVDPAKAVFDTEAFYENPGKYISLYLAIGRQNPGIYLRAFRNLVFSYLNMGKSIRRGLALEETFKGISHLSIIRYNLLPSYYAFLESQLEKEHYFLPMQPGISIYLMVIGIGVSIERKNRKMLLCILPVAIYFIGLLLGPMALLRYLYPMMLASPLLFGILFWQET